MTATPETIRSPVAGETGRQDFSGSALEVRGETASTALAAQAKAAVEARFIMALQRPRDIELARVRILAACKRPMFADTALYSKPVGRAKNEETDEWEEKFAEGLSIRFAEEAIRALGNAMTEAITLYDDQRKRVVRFSATDLETNVVHYKDITVEKTVERRFLKKGQAALGQRINSYGDIVYLVEATEDDLAKKEGALGAKALRDKILMLLPSDIQEEAKAQIKKTQKDRDAKDPEAAKRAVIDAFSAFGVMPNQLAEFVGHDLAAVQPAELQGLRAIYAAIKDGDTTWAAVIEQRQETKTETQAAQSTQARPSNLDEAAARARASRENSKARAKETPAPKADAGHAMVKQKAASLKPPLAEAELLKWYDGASKIEDLSPDQVTDALDRIGLLAGH